MISSQVSSKVKVKAKINAPAMTAKEFNKLNKFQKRVAIAKDVLAQLASKNFKSNHGQYFGFEQKRKLPSIIAGGRLRTVVDILDQDESPISGLSAQEWLQDSANVCHVCAKGALVCSAIRTINKRKIGELNEVDPVVVKIFGARIWDELECMFEGWNLISMAVSTDPEARTWDQLLFGSRKAMAGYDGPERGSPIYQHEDYKRKRTSLEDLMKNIIKNKGALKTQKGVYLY